MLDDASGVNRSAKHIMEGMPRSAAQREGTKMIKTNYKTTVSELNQRFQDEIGRRLPGFGLQETDSYSGTLTLCDDCELEGRRTVLYISPDDYCVQVEDEDGELAWESHEKLADAVEAYGRMTAEYGTNASNLGIDLEHIIER